jgi:hypothetical protein
MPRPRCRWPKGDGRAPGGVSVCDRRAPGEVGLSRHSERRRAFGPRQDLANQRQQEGAGLLEHRCLRRTLERDEPFVRRPDGLEEGPGRLIRGVQVVPALDDDDRHSLAGERCLRRATAESLALIDAAQAAGQRVAEMLAIFPQQAGAMPASIQFRDVSVDPAMTGRILEDYLRARGRGASARPSLAGGGPG